jgi:hypothetical protein
VTQRQQGGAAGVMLWVVRQCWNQQQQSWLSLLHVEWGVHALCIGAKPLCQCCMSQLLLVVTSCVLWH